MNNEDLLSCLIKMQTELDILKDRVREIESDRLNFVSQSQFKEEIYELTSEISLKIEDLTGVKITAEELFKLF